MWYHLLDEAFSNIKHSRFVSLLCIVIITLTIAITSALVLMSTYLRQEVEVLKDEPAIIVFLKETTNESARRSLQQQIAKHSRIKSVTYISKADALTRSKEAFGELAALITESFDDLNPLPASLEVHVEAAFLNREMLAELASQFSTFSEVEEVTYEQFSSDFIRKAEWVILGFSGLMGGTSVVIVCFSTMLAAYFRREELRVVRLMGATRWYIRIPLILQGVFLGFIGSLAGIGGFYALFRFFTPRLGDLAFLSLSQLALIVLGGVLLGLLGSLLPLNKYVNV